LHNKLQHLLIVVFTWRENATVQSESRRATSFNFVMQNRNTDLIANWLPSLPRRRVSGRRMHEHLQQMIFLKANRKSLLKRA
jgi:hypothetical protein